MGVDRREFFKIAGLTALALIGKQVTDTLVGEEHSPKEGSMSHKRYAMVVDIKKCKASEGCKDCILACHEEHNVPQFDNPKDEIKWIWTESYDHTFPNQEHPFMNSDFKKRPVIVLCNHCENPACVRVCPTKATFKREEDGIVLVDPHRCIGCRYCMAACPYGARSFNWRNPRPFIKKMNPNYPPRDRGVVEKCNFCEERLAKGLPPACVEACKEKALVFGDLEDPKSEIREILNSHYTIRRKPNLGTNPQVYYIV